MAKNVKKGWFDEPRNFRLFLRCFYGSLLLLLVIDFFIHKHPDFYFEDAPNFFAAYGFISCVLLVLAAKVLRWFIKRNEDYYDR